jgi:hypothetical protein
MAGEIRGHDVRARPGVPVLFDQIGKRLVDKSLYLPPFFAGEGADGDEDIGIDLRCEFFPWHESASFSIYLRYHDKS